MTEWERACELQAKINKRLGQHEDSCGIVYWSIPKGWRVLDDEGRPTYFSDTEAVIYLTGVLDGITAGGNALAGRP